MKNLFDLQRAHIKGTLTRLMGLESTYQAFWRRCVRNLVTGTALSIVPAGAFYFFVFPYTTGQLAVLAALGTLDLLIFLPLDIAVLKWTLRDVAAAVKPQADHDKRLEGLAALLDAPRR